VLFTIFKELFFTFRMTRRIGAMTEALAQLKHAFNEKGQLMYVLSL